MSIHIDIFRRNMEIARRNIEIEKRNRTASLFDAQAEQEELEERKFDEYNTVGFETLIFNYNLN